MKTTLETAFANDKDVEAALIAGLEAYNDGHCEPSHYKPVQAVLRDEAGRVVGGAMGQILFRWMNVKYVWVDATLRGQDAGTSLMQALEAMARAEGCLGMKVNTFSFQARGFYEKLGFRCFATFDGFPPGHDCHYLRRDF